MTCVLAGEVAEAIFGCAGISVTPKVNQWQRPHMSKSIISALHIATTELEMTHMLHSCWCVCVFVCLVNTVKLPVCSSHFPPLTKISDFTLRIKCCQSSKSLLFYSICLSCENL